MKNILIECIAILTAMLMIGCGTKSHEGTYVASVKSEYSTAEDTIVIKQDIIINRVGYRRILNGHLQRKEFSQKTWRTNSLDAPIIEMGDNQIIIGTTIYKQIR